MQLTGCHNDNEMRNAMFVDTKISIEVGPTVHSYSVLLPWIFKAALDFECCHGLLKLLQDILLLPSFYSVAVNIPCRRCHVTGPH